MDAGNCEDMFHARRSGVEQGMEALQKQKQGSHAQQIIHLPASTDSIDKVSDQRGGWGK